MQSQVSRKLKEEAARTAMSMPENVDQKEIDGYPGCVVRRERSMPPEMSFGELIADKFCLNGEDFLIFTQTDLQ